MLMKKFFIFFIILIILLPSISLNVASLENGDETDESNNNSPLIDFLLKLRFRLGFWKTFGFGRYFVRQLRPPVPIQPYPSTVTLDYLNKTTIQIGGKNPETGEWEKLVKISGTWDWGWMSPSVIFTFEFVPPEDAEDDVFNVIFDPEKLVMRTNKNNLNWPGAEQPLKTNMTIMLKPSVDPTFPTRDIVLKVNIVREEVLDKFRILSGPPKYAKTQEYLEKINDLGVPNPYWDTRLEIFGYRLFFKYSMLLMNLPLPNYDKWIDSTIPILVKVNPYHQVDIPPPLAVEIEPYQVKSIPLTIKNIGSHIDTFNFRVRHENENFVVTPPPALTLKPGEVGEALLGVAAPKQFLSIGSTSLIFFEAYSVEDPEAVFSNTITLITRGIYVTGEAFYSTVSIIITLVIILLIVLFFFRKRREQYGVQPDKPWKIPEEKRYLKELKEKDKEQYEKTLEMMNDEYRSSLLWYKYYVEAAINKRMKVKKQDLAKKKEEKLKLKAKIKEKKKEKKAIELETKKKEMKEKEPEIKEVEPKLPKEKEEKLVLIDRKSELEKRKKEITLSKIKRDQEKQRKKIRSSI